MFVMLRMCIDLLSFFLMCCDDKNRVTVSAIFERLTFGIFYILFVFFHYSGKKQQKASKEGKT